MNTSQGTPASPLRPPRGGLPTTQWSRVRRAALGGDDAQAALEELCRLYHPLVLSHLMGDPAFRLRKEDAEDLAQSFFLEVLKGAILAKADPERGRFRTYLKACLRHFWIKERARQMAVKRGGGLSFEAWDGLSVQQEAAVATPADEAVAQFDAGWGRYVLQLARRQVRERYAKLPRRGLERFEALMALFEQDTPGVREQLRARLGLSEAHLKQEIHRLRQRFHFALLEIIGSTLHVQADVEDEMRYLARLLRDGRLDQFFAPAGHD